tara:strand:- start:944 stop:1705 length:762 start_codon:yes stop_codon:yes gene_type:complete
MDIATEINSNGIKSNSPLKELRKRILQIAASYIGQTTYNTRKGFNDAAFEQKMKNVGWQSNLHYCNNFVRLVYKEALTTGNQYVNSTLNYPGNWDGRLTHLKDIKAWKRKSFGMEDPFVEHTRYNYQLLSRYVNITDYSMTNWGTDSNKPLGIATSKRKGQPKNLKYVTENSQRIVLPGDIITFDWSNSGRYNDHIGLYVCPADINCKRIITIEGNTTPKGKVNGVWKCSRSAESINGFGQLTVLPTNVQKLS